MKKSRNTNHKWRTRHAIPFLFLALMGTGKLNAQDDIYAVQSRISSPNFQLFNHLNDDSTVANSGPLFSPAGGVYAVAAIPPDAPTAPFQISSITKSGGTYTISWPSEAGFSYQLRFNSALTTAGWMNVGTAQSGTGNPLSKDHTPTETKGFYQVVKTPVPLGL